jgi:hypothetical protein
MTYYISLSSKFYPQISQTLELSFIAGYWRSNLSFPSDQKPNYRGVITAKISRSRDDVKQPPLTTIEEATG